jgi:hypothetical protein
MKSIGLLTAIIFLCIASQYASAQDSLVTEIAKKNSATFSVEKNAFKGSAWDTLVRQIQKSDFVLIGEDHFTNEIPFFYSAVSSAVKFDNFFCEIDPYSAKLIESAIKNLSEVQLKTYVREFGDVFSFYALEPEFQLLKQMVQLKTSIFGVDQILIVADRLICNELKLKTKSENAKKIYEHIEQNSKIHFAEFLKNQNKPFYLLTGDFEKQIAELLSFKLSPEENEKIKALKLTAKIYKEQNHHLRVQLLKSNLMKIYAQWENKKSLFKFGANHLAKGESLLKIYDIGNLINNVADSKFKKSLHILIIGKSGTQASPFMGFPEQIVDENGDNLKCLKPLFNTITTDQWYCFDMHPLEAAIDNGKIVIKDIQLLRIIKGYDYVVIIPRVSASKFPKSE